MALFAHIVGQVVTEVRDLSHTPDTMFPPGMTWVDVSHVMPQPQPGWGAMHVPGAGYTYEPPAPVEPPEPRPTMADLERRLAALEAHPLLRTPAP